ncbi:N-acetylmuramoyl-L-alanine amidase family protein [Geosporobacter ferrireducens]|uniref:MurNAc-LAA domain-containing protein n=1 Tax=Geosporobacter ferrireducens TaxID=1424294 RepID=A0A1D8GFX4_9FIRM|nr:N-acetylmuramoyl-L-alanine amidase family protein [Geosporobacter ferrireducens]AOT69790.1 hypothetical protein Gferi_09485 [Geosporobacter ferrireducens]MTI54497.1 AMIN domain-containing protein [Geosporobacter ferrireducens]
MKRFIAFLLVFTFVLSTYSTAFAAKSEATSIRVVDGVTKKSYDITVVNLLMGGKDVVTDVPTMLFNNRTLVPIAFVVENLGAKIEWNQKERKATITMADKTIVLQIDSPTALVNGKKVTLPDQVPAKLLGYKDNFRTMVPLRFISEQLGMDVNWISQTTTATVDFPKQSVLAIDYDTDSRLPQIIIKTTGQVGISSFYLEGSKVGGTDRLVLDLPNVQLNMQDRSIVDASGAVSKNIGQNGIRGVRASLFEPAPREIARIVFDLDVPKGYNIHFDKAKNEIRVQFLNGIKQVKLEKKNNTDAIVVYTEDSPVYNTLDLGDRMVVDILNAQLKTDSREINIAKGGVKKVRMAPFAPDSNYNPDDKIVRIVLDLEEGQTTENIHVEEDGNNLLIYFQAKPLKDIDYRKEAYNRSVFNLQLTAKGSFDADYDSWNSEYVVTVPKQLAELQSMRLNTADNIIEYIQIDDKSDEESYVIRLKLAAGTDYRLLTSAGVGDRISILFENLSLEESKEEPKYSGGIVVLDPGHGGKDPGAVSPKLGLKEKDLALDVSLRLNKLLEDAGFTTIMTRTDDTYIDLYERAGIANGMNADVFVSVHFNAHPSSQINGVQTLYNGTDTKRDNKTFAQMMQQEMIKEMGAVDRNIVDRPNLVVIRETNMPAVLAELAFITNAQEESLAATEEYRQKCAQALFNGITRYFNEVLGK